MKTIPILVASSGKNLELAKSLNDILGELGWTGEIIPLIDLNLPLYSTVAEKEGIPDKAKTICEKLIQAKGLIFLAPEYNGGVPPTLNNLIAWVSRASEEWRDAFNNKPAVVGTHSGGGGLHGLMAMRMQLSYIGMNVLGRQIHTHYSKPLDHDSAKDTLGRFIELIGK